MAQGYWLHPLSLWLHHSFHCNLLFSYAISIAKCWPLGLHFSVLAPCPKGEFFHKVWAKSFQGPWLLLFRRCQDSLLQADCIANALFLWAIINPTIHHVKPNSESTKKPTNQSFPYLNVCKNCLGLQMAADKEKRHLTGRHRPEQNTPLMRVLDPTTSTSGTLGLQRQLLRSGVKCGLQGTATQQATQ